MFCTHKTIGSNPIISKFVKFFKQKMRLCIYSKYIYNFDKLYKYNDTTNTRNCMVRLCNENIYTNYADYIFLEFTTSQKVCFFTNIITLRKKNYWFFLDNCLCSLSTDIKKSVNFFVYLQNSIIFKNLQINKEIATKLINNISIKFRRIA